MTGVNKKSVSIMAGALVLASAISLKPAAAEPFAEGVAAYQRGDYLTAMRRFQSPALQGNGDAQYNVGFMYAKGMGVHADAAVAAKWYQKAADLGVVDAQCDLGLLHLEGEGVPKDYAAALGLFRKAAQAGDARAEMNLGDMYYNGWGVTQDFTEAMAWNRKAADQGFADAEQHVGALYGSGQGVAKDVTEAVRWYRRGAEHGSQIPQFQYGYALATGSGIAPNPEEAKVWLGKAAKVHYPNAQALLNIVTKTLKENPQVFAQSLPPQSAVAKGDQALEDADPNQKTAANTAASFNQNDLSRIVGTYRENQMRFKRDFFGRQFRAVLPFQNTTERLLAKNTYTVGFGAGSAFSDVDCVASTPSDIAVIANWNRGDRILVEGVIKDVTLGAIQLSDCHLSK